MAPWIYSKDISKTDIISISHFTQYIYNHYVTIVSYWYLRMAIIIVLCPYKKNTSATWKSQPIVVTKAIYHSTCEPLIDIFTNAKQK